MNTFAKFQIIGNVGKVEIADNRIRISVANNVSYKDRENEGQYIEKTEWNEVTMFEGTPRYDWVKRELKKGDLVHIEGSFKQTSWVKDGKTVYGTNFNVREIMMWK